MTGDLFARYLLGVPGVKEIWLIRHAQAEDGLADPGLSAVGASQAERLAERLRPVRFDAIVSSDLARSRETAAVLAQGRGLEPRADPRLREVRTHWDEGRTHRLEAPDVYPFPEPESEVRERMRAGVTDALAALDTDAGTPRAAVIGHSAAMLTYLLDVLGLRWGQLRMMLSYTSVTVIARKDEVAVVRSIGDVTHLADR